LRRHNDAGLAGKLTEMPSDPNSKTRVVIAFLSLIIIFSVGAYFVGDLVKLQESIAARDSRTALQGITDPGQIDEALRQQPQNRLLQLMAMATKAANETNAAVEKLSSEIEPPAIAKTNNLGGASRSDLEALFRDSKAAEANATTFLPRYVALLKTERDNVEKYARSLDVGKNAVGKLLDNVDRRHAEITAFISRMLPARAESYRAYQNYVALLVAAFGSYKVVNGQLIFPFQRDVDRYNVAANAMTAAAKRVADLDEERKSLLKSQQERWSRFVSGK
jgi:hypothetical protein